MGGWGREGWVSGRVGEGGVGEWAGGRGRGG